MYEESAWPQQQAHERAAIREPQQGEQDWQSDDKVVDVQGEKAWYEQPGLGFDHAHPRFGSGP